MDIHGPVRGSCCRKALWLGCSLPRLSATRQLAPFADPPEGERVARSLEEPSGFSDQWGHRDLHMAKSVCEFCAQVVISTNVAETSAGRPVYCTLHTGFTSMLGLRSPCPMCAALMSTSLATPCLFPVLLSSSRHLVGQPMRDFRGAMSWTLGRRSGGGASQLPTLLAVVTCCFSREPAVHGWTGCTECSVAACQQLPRPNKIV